MRAENLENTPSREEMKGGLRDLSERIAREVPVLARISWPSRSDDVKADFQQAAACLHGVEDCLCGLWPRE